MQYELKNVEFVGSVRKKDDNTFIQTVNATTGVVGQTYNGFTNMDSIDIEFPASGMDANQIQTLIQQQSAAYVANKYPDTIAS